MSFLTFTPQLGGLEGLSEMEEAPCLSKLSSFLHGSLSRLRRFFCTWLQANVWKSVKFSVGKAGVREVSIDNKMGLQGAESRSFNVVYLFLCI